MRKFIFGLVILAITSFAAFACMDDVKEMFDKWKVH